MATNNNAHANLQQLNSSLEDGANFQTMMLAKDSGAMTQLNPTIDQSLATCLSSGSTYTAGSTLNKQNGEALRQHPQ